MIRSAFLIICSISTIAASQLIPFEIQYGKVVKSSFTYSEVYSRTLLRCIGKCTENIRCQAVSYNENATLCRLTMERVKGVDHKYRLQTKAAWNTLSLRKDCKSGWYKVDETCYFLVKTMRNYDEAKKNCKSKGAKLAEPPSKASWKMMTNFLKETYESTSCCSWYWVGLNDKKKENSFVWTSNGRKVGYNAWYQRGQPNGGRKQNCVGIPKYGKYTWADRVCAYGSPSICEM